MLSPCIPRGDVISRDDDEDYVLSAPGFIKLSYLSMVEENVPKAAHFMDEYYKLLAMRKDGKTAAAIKREVRRMSRDEAIDWIERTYERFIHEPWEVLSILQGL